jgi:hypothetical protein
MSGSRLRPTSSVSRDELALPGWLHESDSRRIASLAPDPPVTEPTVSDVPQAAGTVQLEVCRDGQRLGRHVFTQRQVRVGRSPRCELHLDDPTISRFHAVVEEVGGRYRVRDLRSSNGIKVNGKTVKGWQLSRGDLIRVGEFELIFSSDRPPAGRGDEGVADDAESSRRLLGSTTRIANGRLDPELREASLPARAYLRPQGRRSQGAPLQHVIGRDAFILGAGERVDLRIDGWLIPRIVAVVVRGYEGHSLQPVSAWPRVKVNRRAVTHRCALEDGDEITVGAVEFTFHVAL